MKIKYSLVYSENWQFHAERDLESCDLDGIRQAFEAALDLRALRHENYLLRKKLAEAAPTGGL